MVRRRRPGPGPRRPGDAPAAHRGPAPRRPPGASTTPNLKPDFARLAEVAQVVWLDLPGHGRSDHGDPTSWSFEGCADDVRGFCEVLGIDRPVVFGHSLGGFVAMLYGARMVMHRAINAPGLALMRGFDEGTTRLEVFGGAGHFTWKDTRERYWPPLLEFVAGVR